MRLRGEEMIARDLLQKTMRLGIKLIPLEAGRKETFEPGWPDKPAETTITGLVKRLASYNKTTAAAVNKALDGPVQEFPFNVGCHNEQSGVLIIDADDEQAYDALIAGMSMAASVPPHEAEEALSGALMWQSVKGIKYLFRLPKNTPPGLRRSCALIRHLGPQRNGRTSQQTVLELRCTGQDAVPPSLRAAQDLRLMWLSKLPAKLPMAPPELMALHQAIIERSDGVMTALHDLIGSETDWRIKATSESDYPSELLAPADVRAYINGTLDVAQLLERDPEIEKVGRRYKYRGAPGSAAIAPPRKAGEMWQCWNASSPLYGHFDAWRYVVEVDYQGGKAPAVRDTLELMSGVRRKKEAHPLAGDPPPSKGTAKKPREVEETRTGKKPAASSQEAPSKSTGYQHNFKRPKAPVLFDGGITIGAGLTLMMGKAKQGKTYTAIGLALAATIPGFSYADTVSTRPLKVLIYGPDMTEDEYAEVIESIAGERAKSITPGALEILAGPDVLEDVVYPAVDPQLEVDEDATQAVVSYAKQRCVDLLIVDMLFNLEIAQGDVPRDPMAKQYMMAARLRNAAQAAGIAVIALHWTRKGTKKSIDWGSPGDEVAGMGALAGGSTAIIITGVVGDHGFTSGHETNDPRAKRPLIRVAMVSSGRQANWERVFEVDRDAGTVAWVQGLRPKDAAVGTSIEEEIVEWVANKQQDPARPGEPQPVKAEEIVARFLRPGASETTIRNTLLPRMTRAGRLISKRGRSKESGYYVPLLTADNAKH